MQLYAYFVAKVIFLFEIWKKNTNFAANFIKKQRFENNYTHYPSPFADTDCIGRVTETRNPRRMAYHHPGPRLAPLPLREPTEAGTHQHPRPAAARQH